MIKCSIDISNIPLINLPNLLDHIASIFTYNPNFPFDWLYLPSFNYDLIRYLHQPIHSYINREYTTNQVNLSLPIHHNFSANSSSLPILIQLWYVKFIFRGLLIFSLGFYQLFYLNHFIILLIILKLI